MNYDQAVEHYRTLMARRTVTVDEFVAPAAETTTEDSLAEVLWAAWEAVVGAAAEADEEVRTALVALVVGVRAHTLTDARGRPRTVGGRRAFGDLPVFGAQMREAWNFPDDPAAAAAWTRLNAFAAQLTAAGQDFTLYALWSIGTALETCADPALHLPAALQWFRYCGPELVAAARHGRTYGPGPGRLHELAERDGLTEGGFTVPRWLFWRSRLDGLARAGDDTAREGLRLMRRYDAQLIV